MKISSNIYKWPASHEKMLSITNHQGNASQSHSGYHCTPIGTAAVSKPRKQHALARTWGNGSPRPWRWECKMVQPLWEMVRQVLLRLNTASPVRPAIPLSAHTREKDKQGLEQSPCTVHTAALLAQVSADRWSVNWCPHTAEYRSSWKGVGFLRHATTWVHLEGIKWN